ncbi:hypothetical protein [Sorangium sp. So ce1024]|uniref:hypothetical protein n=1 Tax=unclassified Sorangium TaxID=2621164 RepID=UPI003F0F4F53
MTVRSVSWTDAQRVSSLLAQVTAPRSQERTTLVSPMAPPRPAAPAKAAPAQVKVAPRPPKEVPRLVQTSDNPADRLDALVAWTLAHQACVGAFVADDNGLTLAAHGISEAHVSLVGPLLSALVGVRSVPGVDATAGALWLGAQMMSWVETRTARGGFCLGTVGDEALSTRAFEQLKEALETTVRGL